MDLKFEVHLVSQDSCTPPSLKIVKLSDNGRNVNKENVNEKNEGGKALLHRIVENPNTQSTPQQLLDSF